MRKATWISALSLVLASHFPEIQPATAHSQSFSTLGLTSSINLAQGVLIQWQPMIASINNSCRLPESTQCDKDSERFADATSSLADSMGDIERTSDDLFVKKEIANLSPAQQDAVKNEFSRFVSLWADHIQELLLSERMDSIPADQRGILKTSLSSINQSGHAIKELLSQNYGQPFAQPLPDFLDP